MRRVAELSAGELRDSLRTGRFCLQTGPLRQRIRCDMDDVAAVIARVYADHPCELDPAFADFHVELSAPRNLRRWMRPQAQFLADGVQPFEPLPRDQAPALLEWGLNWLIAATSHQWLSIHAASLERNGQAVLLPAPPGSGKSTLCATLALRGWRLLSDELTLLEPGRGQLRALARPINLKNASIDLIRAFEPTAVWSPDCYDTTKGRVTHLKPPRDAVLRMQEPAAPRWIVFPRYVAGAEPELRPRSKVATFNHFAENAFNYSVLGELGFEMVADLVDRCDCYDFSYSRLDDALEVFDWLLLPDEH